MYKSFMYDVEEARILWQDSLLMVEVTRN